MNYLLLPFLFSLMSLVSACDSQRNSAATTTSDTAPAAEMATAVEDITIEELDARYPEAEKAYFAGGCFWCTEASFTRIQGVVDVYSGYAGDTAADPSYKQVSSGQTGYAEAIVVYYNPDEITYDKLLDIFFVAHDPTQVDRQGPDVGPQYRSAIFPLSDQQREQAEAKIAALNASGKFDAEIATNIEDTGKFYVAEAYHQNYYEDPTNPNQGYVQGVSRPKVEKVMKEFRDILKPEFQ